ncbi:MAG: DUF1653 domain-containing protein [Lachnospirales bacterium]
MVQTGIYKHFKGNVYEVLGECIDNNIKYVIYMPLDNTSKFWIREYNMFFEKVTRNNKTFDRFELIEKKNNLLNIESTTVIHSETLDELNAKKISEGMYVLL